jgi:hypothetical protein
MQMIIHLMTGGQAIRHGPQVSNVHLLENHTEVVDGLGYFIRWSSLTNFQE